MRFADSLDRRCIVQRRLTQEKHSMSAKYEIHKSSDSQFFFNLHSANGEKILTSELYKAKASAYVGIEAVRKNAPHDARYDRRVDVSKKSYFVLKAAGNNEVIGRSESYSTDAAMENGIAAVKRDGPSAVVADFA
jgi:uncharacterized protein